MTGCAPANCFYDGTCSDGCAVEKKAQRLMKAIIKLLQANQVALPPDATEEDIASAIEMLSIPPIAEALVDKLDASGAAAVRAIIERPGKPRVEIRARYVSG